MTFVNTYNFISLENVEKGSKKKYGDYFSGITDRFTGKIKCRLITRTELIIPDSELGEKSVAKVKKSGNYPFMMVDERPMIPGSSLRGVFKSALEALTDSCVFANDDYYFSSRTGNPKIAGLLKKTAGGWELLESRRYSDKNCNLPSDEYKTGDPIKFDGEERDEARGKTHYNYKAHYLTAIGHDAKKGYVLIMNPFAKKSSGRNVFEKLSDTPIKTFTDNDMKTFEENIKKYLKGGAKQRAKEYKQKFDSLKVGEMIPVWYEQHEDKYYFALSQMSRNVYTKKPANLLKEKNLQVCTKKDALCPACALFGFIGENNDSIGSRVRFSDAWCTEGKETALSDKKVRLLLMSPRSSSLEFYLRHNENFYHADYDGVKLSGRKFYWHNQNFNVKEFYKPTKNPGISSDMQYAKKGIVFEFDVYFDGVTEEELNQLYTALTYGDKEDGPLCHKIGHGKPLGFGSVKVVADEAIVRVYSNGVYKEDLKKLLPIEIPDDVLKAADFYSIPKEQKIDYPRYAGNGDIFKWFSENRPLGENSPFFVKLPEVAASEQSMTTRPETQKHSVKNSGRENQSTSSQPYIPLAKKNETKVNVFSQLAGNKSEEPAKHSHAYGQYSAKQLKSWIVPLYKKDTKTINSLNAFVGDFERGQAEGDNRYKDVAHLYQQAKEKLQNR